MATITIPRDFKEFLKLLDSHKVKFLVIGGYAVSLHGYVRSTNDLDVWVGTDPLNAERVDATLREFGFSGDGLSPDLFRVPGNVIRMEYRQFGLRFSPPFPVFSLRSATTSGNSSQLTS